MRRSTIYLIFRQRAPLEIEDGRTEAGEYWLQRWLAIARSVGIGKHELLEEYYYDEFIAMMDAYNDMHNIDGSGADEEVFADEYD